MKKYLVLYFSTATAREQMSKSTPEQAKAGMDAWTAWAKRVGTAVVDLGSPLAAVGASNPDLGGYSILQAESNKAVEGLLREHPHRMMPGARIEVHEFLPLPGM